MAKDEASEIESEKTSSRRMDRGIDSEAQNDKLWDSIAKNYVDKPCTDLQQLYLVNGLK